MVRRYGLPDGGVRAVLLRFDGRRGQERKLHPEGRALALAGALGGHGASMQLDEVANESEPDAEAALGAGAPALALLEAVEDDRQQLGADAGAGIADDDLEVRADPPQGELDAAVSRRELDRVHQEVPDDLLQTVRVAVERAGARIDQRLQPEPLGLERRPHRVERRFQHPREIDRADVEPHLAADDAGDVEQVVDQLQLHVGIAHDRVERARRRRRVDLAHLEHARPAVDRVHRRPQLV